MIYIGIDNGATGSIGIINGDYVHFWETPVDKVLNYTKKKQMISRINWGGLAEILNPYKAEAVRLRIERPFTGMNYKAVASGARAFEATLIVLEMLALPFEIIDSKEWQKALLPLGLKKSAELKKASCQIGCQLFPQFADEIKKHGDADGLLIAEYLRRSN